MSLLILAVFWLAAVHANTFFSITRTNHALTGDVYTVHQDNVVLWTGGATVSSTTRTIGGSMLFPPVLKSHSEQGIAMTGGWPAGIAAVFNSYNATWNSPQVGTLHAIGASTYAAPVLENAPSRILLIEPDIVCQPSLPFLAVGSTIHCSGTSSGESFIFSTTLLSPSSVTVLVNSSSMTTGSSEFAGVMSTVMSHADSLAAFVEVLDTVDEWNSSRTRTARVAVAFLWVFIAIGSFFGLALQAAWLQAWFNYPKLCFKQGRLHNQLVWTAIFLLVSLPFSWGGGFFGWASIMFVYAAFIVTLFIVYACTTKMCVCCPCQCAKNGCRGSAIHPIIYNAASPEHSGTPEAISMSAISDLRTTGDGSSNAPFDEPTREQIGGPGSSGDKYSVRPAVWSRRQRIQIMGWTLLMAVVFLLIIITLFGWPYTDYLVVDRVTHESTIEIAPVLISKASLMIYAFGGLGKLIRMEPFWEVQTAYCGATFNRRLGGNRDKYNKIQVDFIDLYKIDMSIYARPSYTQYSTVNDWFTRPLVSPMSSVRPIAFLNDSQVIVSPSDARINVFPNIDVDAKIWFKGEHLSVNELLNGISPSTFAGGSLVMVRLAPADYHRNHAPVAGTITTQRAVDGALFSVNADAIRAEDEAIYNKRVVNIISSPAADGTTHPLRQVAFIPIGATCVGSIVMTVPENVPFNKGDELSFFQFGGSTVALLFPPGAVQWDDDLVYASSRGQELLVRVGMQIGRWLV